MGILQLDIVVRGLPSHASQPWYGVNAFEDGVRIAHALINDLKPRIEDRQFLGERAAITLGGFVGGGYSRNIVPNYFQFSIDRRILPNEDLETVHNELINYINTLRDGVKSAIDIYIVNRVEPALNNKSDLLGKLMNSIDHVLHVNPRVGISRFPLILDTFKGPVWMH